MRSSWRQHGIIAGKVEIHEKTGKELNCDDVNQNSQEK